MEMGLEKLRTYFRLLLRSYADFPKKGVKFLDIFSLLAVKDNLRCISHWMDDIRWKVGGNTLAAIESRGFILGAALSTYSGAGFVPIRKAGKLPGPTWRKSCRLEYGPAVLELQKDTFLEGERVLIVDDVLATGGTASASIELLRKAGANPVGCCFLLEIKALKAREKIKKTYNLPCFSLLIV